MAIWRTTSGESNFPFPAILLYPRSLLPLSHIPLFSFFFLLLFHGFSPIILSNRYTIIALEQSAHSTSLPFYEFPEKVCILLGLSVHSASCRCPAMPSLYYHLNRERERRCSRRIVELGTSFIHACIQSMNNSRPRPNFVVPSCHGWCGWHRWIIASKYLSLVSFVR
jgi:hypothetical protein